MTWHAPELVELNMSAEIGGYQEDFDERGDAPAFPLAQPAAEDAPSP